MRLGLSKKLGLPCVKVGDSPALSIKQIIKLMKFNHKELGKYVVVYDDNYFFITDRFRYFCEWDKWVKDYFFPRKLIHKIFDVGSDCGTTNLFFYLNYGIRYFDNCEIDYFGFNLSKINSYLNDYSIHCSYNREFDVDMVTENQDLLKVDIEGGEKVLLACPEIKPIIVEVHGSELFKKFLEKGFSVRRKNVRSKYSKFDMVAIMDNFDLLGME